MRWGRIHHLFEIGGAWALMFTNNNLLFHKDQPNSSVCSHISKNGFIQNKQIIQQRLDFFSSLAICFKFILKLKFCFHTIRKVSKKKCLLFSKNYQSTFPCFFQSPHFIFNFSNWGIRPLIRSIKNKLSWWVHEGGHICIHI